MIALYILGGILLLLVLIAIIRVRFIISYYGALPRLDIKIGPFTYEDYFEDLDLENADLKAELKKRKQKKKKGAVSTKSKKLPKISDAVRIIKDGIAAFLKYFSRYARLDKYRVRISLATDDPARTAILYGSLSAVVSTMHSYALSVKRRSYREGDIYTEYKPDFYSEKSDIAIDIGFSLRIWQILVCYYIYNSTVKKLNRLPPKADNKTKGDTDNE